MATKKPAAKPAGKALPKKAAAKPVAKKAVAKPVAKAAPAPAEIKPIKEALTKTALLAKLAEISGVEPKDVKKVFAALEGVALASVSKKGLGEFTLPGLMKVMAVKIAAKPKRKGINPFTGQEQVFAAKPATIRVKVRPLKKLKDAAL
jgi:nucleoid DNA-binding protein